MSEKTIIALIIALAITGSTMFFTFGSLLSKNKDFQLKQNQIENNKRMLTECQYRANDNYDAVWNRACADRGLADDCMLPQLQATAINKATTEQLDRCVELYK